MNSRDKFENVKIWKFENEIQNPNTNVKILEFENLKMKYKRADTNVKISEFENLKMKYKTADTNERPIQIWKF